MEIEIASMIIAKQGPYAADNRNRHNLIIKLIMYACWLVTKAGKTKWPEGHNRNGLQVAVNKNMHN